jgi:hypothetical protein
MRRNMGIRIAFRRSGGCEEIWPAGRAHYAWGGYFVTGGPVWVGLAVWVRALPGLWLGISFREFLEFVEPFREMYVCSL